MTKTYETERLLLKTPDLSFAFAITDYYRRNREFLKEWEPARDDEFYTLEHQKKQLKKQILDRRSLSLWIFKKEDLSKTIGYLGFTNIVTGVFLSCFLGYKLDEMELNKGYMTEAVKKGIEIIFEEYGLHRIEANIMPRNKRSLRVMEKLGFHREGLAYRYLNINGKWEDHVHMVLLNDEK